MKASNILQTIGHTPHVRINRLFGDGHEVWMKLERANPGGSIKDRIALSMIEDAEKKGELKPGSVVIEPTSGNTGIGLAMVCAVKGYRLILVMPESMSVERRRLMAAYGASFELTPRELGMKGSIQKAIELAAATPGAWIPGQFENEANIRAHREHTAAEILQDFPSGGRGSQEEISLHEGLRRGALSFARDQRRRPRASSASGTGRGLHPEEPPQGCPGRRHPG